ncbi:MAG: Uma2 family endonuclease [Planctomycetaceae bacterium]|nr:Uma2 family endonuclease [Planctomycetaceae bacterium]
MAGILNDDRVELINGYLVRKMGKNPPHCWSTRELLDRLAHMLPPGWMWQQDQPVRIPNYDEPEPDIAIVRGTNDDYKHRTPEPSDVALLVEVSESTYDRDRGEKWTTYAKGGFPVYWIIILAKGRVEVYTDPSPAGYQSREDFQPGQQVPVTIGGQPLRPIPVADILP